MAAMTTYVRVRETCLSMRPFPLPTLSFLVSRSFDCHVGALSAKLRPSVNNAILHIFYLYSNYILSIF